MGALRSSLIFLSLPKRHRWNLHRAQPAPRVVSFHFQPRSDSFGGDQQTNRMWGSYGWLLEEFDLFLGNYWVRGITRSLCLRKAAGKLGHLVVRNMFFFTFTAGRQTGIMRWSRSLLLKFCTLTCWTVVAVIFQKNGLPPCPPVIEDDTENNFLKAARVRSFEPGLVRLPCST